MGLSLGLLGFVTVAHGAPKPGGGIFHTVCGYSHSLPDDPIVHPGQPGASHMHDFGGNATTNAFSTLASLQAGATNCIVNAPDPQADRSGYWVPQLYFNGSPVSFSEQQAYYQSGNQPYVNTPPVGLEVVAGNHHATSPQSTSVVKFTCSGSAGSAIGGLDYPPICPAGSLLKIVIFTPNCLAHTLVVNGADGKDDTSQATYAVKGVCPTGFDPIAQVRIEVKYPAGVDGRGTIAFSPDSGSTTLSPYYTMHADWFNAWDPTTLNNFVQGCINAGIDCGNTMPLVGTSTGTGGTSTGTGGTSTGTGGTSTGTGGTSTGTGGTSTGTGGTSTGTGGTSTGTGGTSTGTGGTSTGTGGTSTGDGGASAGNSGVSTGSGIFHTICGYSHSLPDDPIVHPGQPGAAHMHDFGGNTTTNASSTLASLQAGTTNCIVNAPDPQADRSGYWVPQLYFNGSPVSFSELQAYYQSGNQPFVNPPPVGLEVVAGDHHATGPQSTSVVKFTCSGAAGSVIGGLNYPPICPAGSLLKIVVFTPNCLAHSLVANGADGQDDTSQATYAVNGVCPTGYDPIAQVRIEVKYPAGVDGRGTIAFSPDPGSATLSPYYTMHADWFNAWDPTTLNTFVQGCINAGIDCGNTVP